MAAPDTIVTTRTTATGLTAAEQRYLEDTAYWLSSIAWPLDELRQMFSTLMAGGTVEKLVADGRALNMSIPTIGWGGSYLLDFKPSVRLEGVHQEAQRTASHLFRFFDSYDRFKRLGKDEDLRAAWNSLELAHSCWAATIRQYHERGFFTGTDYYLGI